MEGINNNAHGKSEKSSEQLDGAEKLKAILPLFGTDAAREAFIQNCKNYVEARARAIHESYAPDVSVRRHAVTSGPKQAVLHNKIMDAINRLANQAPDVSPEQRAILIEMFDRDVTAEILKKFVESLGVPVANEEDEEEGGRKKGMSDTAYYHSLGKEH